MQGTAGAALLAHHCLLPADTTIGLLLTIGLHKAALRAACWYGKWHSQQYGLSKQSKVVQEGDMPVATADARERWFTAMQLCGHYGEAAFVCLFVPLHLHLPQCTSCTAGDPPSYRRWGLQLGEWVACVIVARAMCGLLVLLLGSLLVHAAEVSKLFAAQQSS